MVNCPDALVWELVQKNNCFMKKVNGRTKRTGTISFSVEKGNLRSISAPKYSGISRSQSVDVVPTDDNRAQLLLKTASKAATQPKKGVAATPLNKDFRRTVHCIEANVQNNFYRPDLTSSALAKYSKVYRANRIAKGVKKPVPVKKGRSKKA